MCKCTAPLDYIANNGCMYLDDDMNCLAPDECEIEYQIEESMMDDVPQMPFCEHRSECKAFEDDWCNCFHSSLEFCESCKIQNAELWKRDDRK